MKFPILTPLPALAAVKNRPWFQRLPEEGKRHFEQMARTIASLKGAITASESRETTAVTRIAACHSEDFMSRIHANNIFDGHARQHGAHFIPDNGGIYIKPNLGDTSDSIISISLARPANPDSPVMISMYGNTEVNFQGCHGSLSIHPNSSNVFRVTQRGWGT